jgi:hypothetical protein
LVVEGPIATKLWPALLPSSITAKALPDPIIDGSGCSIVVKVPGPTLAVWTDESIMKDDSSSDAVALEHIAAALQLDSGCGDDGLLADVHFQNMLAHCCGVLLIVCVPARSSENVTIFTQLDWLTAW